MEVPRSVESGSVKLGGFLMARLFIMTFGLHIHGFDGFFFLKIQTNGKRSIKANLLKCPKVTVSICAEAYLTVLRSHSHEPLGYRTVI